MDLLLAALLGAFVGASTLGWWLERRGRLVDREFARWCARYGIRPPD